MVEGEPMLADRMEGGAILTQQGYVAGDSLGEAALWVVW